jgi:hypothetical protein
MSSILYSRVPDSHYQCPECHGYAVEVDWHRGKWVGTARCSECSRAWAHVCRQRHNGIETVIASDGVQACVLHHTLSASLA